MSRAVILGTGLIGASMGQGLRAAGWHIAAWDPDPAVLSEAKALGAVDLELGHGETVPAEDLLVLAGPPSAVLESVTELDTDILTIDVAGVKAPVVAANRLPHFVATHPMAGREMSGPAAASPALFRGAAWVVVTDGADSTDLDRVEDVVRLLGGRPIRMTAQEHDVAVAAISHLPQVLASTLIDEAAAETRALDLAAGSFRDLTRVAASDPDVWAELLTINREAVRAAIAGIAGRLTEFSEALRERDAAHVRAALDRARTLRRSLAPPVVAVRVALADLPGEIAKVGRALETSGVDVRDLQLRHAPYGGGGVLTLSVRPGDEAPLRDALVSMGLVLAQ
jgi:prephenate dehydrogenase